MARLTREEVEQRIAKKYQPLLEQLFEKRDELIDQIKNLSAESLQSNHQAGEELADVGGDDFIRETELSLVGEEEKTFYLIEEALQRMYDGTYGSCVDCGCDIPWGRLEAIPYAKLCVECKQKREENEGIPPEVESSEAEQLVE